MKTVRTDRGAELDIVDNDKVGSGGEADVYPTSDGQHVLKRFRLADHGRQRLAVARHLRDLPKPLRDHGALRALQLPVDIVGDAWGTPGIVYPRVPPNYLGAMRLVLPKAFAALPRHRRSTLRNRLKMSAALAMTIEGFALLVGGHLPDGGLRNVLVDPHTGDLAAIDAESAWIPAVDDTVASSPLFASPEMELGEFPSAASDAYLIAVSAHWLLLGHHPHPESEPRSHLVSPSALGAIFADLVAAGIDRNKPSVRPSGTLWAHQLTWLQDRLVACRNPRCWWGDYVWHPNTSSCAACGTTARTKSVTLIQWLDANGADERGQTAVFAGDTVPLLERHVSQTPTTLSGEPVGRVRSSSLGRGTVLELDGKPSLRLNHGDTVRVGDRRARVWVV